MNSFHIFTLHYRNAQTPKSVLISFYLFPFQSLESMQHQWKLVPVPGAAGIQSILNGDGSLREYSTLSLSSANEICHLTKFFVAALLSSLSCRRFILSLALHFFFATALFFFLATLLFLPLCFSVAILYFSCRFSFLLLLYLLFATALSFCLHFIFLVSLMQQKILSCNNKIIK